jgi:hypothetical protein
MIPAAEIVDLDALLESVAGALVATIGITAAFAIGLRGVVRASERWRNGNTVIGTLWATLAILAIAGAGVGVVVGIGIVASDSPLG